VLTTSGNFVTDTVIKAEVTAAVGRFSGGRRRQAVRAQPDDGLLAAWQEAEPRLRRLVVAMGVGHGDVDDLLQNVYLAARQSGAAPTDDEGRRRWLFRVAINRCRLEHRRKRRWQAVWERIQRVWTEYAGGRIDTAAESEEQAALRLALQRLPPEQRNLIVLRYYCDLSSTDIGQILDLPAATVRGQLSVARRRLAEALREGGFGLDE
jgi:RNA polymerase sigma-70 factor (ECF subfamily)